MDLKPQVQRYSRFFPRPDHVVENSAPHTQQSRSSPKAEPASSSTTPKRRSTRFFPDNNTILSNEATPSRKRPRTPEPATTQIVDRRYSHFFPPPPGTPDDTPVTPRKRSRTTKPASAPHRRPPKAANHSHASSTLRRTRSAGQSSSHKGSMRPRTSKSVTQQSASSAFTSTNVRSSCALATSSC
jgi:hypothetical protein